MSQPDVECYTDRPQCLCLTCANYYYRNYTACCNDSKHITLRETFSCHDENHSAMPDTSHGGRGILWCKDYRMKEGQMSIFSMGVGT